MSEGTTALGIPALQSLVAPSSGYALPHASFSDEQFRHNLRHLLKHTRISKSLCEGPGLDGCILDLRMPRYAMLSLFYDIFYVCLK